MSDLVLNCLKGYGRNPTICLPGFVPKCREAFHKQIGLLRNFGDVWLVDYPDHGFDLEDIIAQLSKKAHGICREGKPPVIVSVSFGSALVMQLLRRKPWLPVRGCVFVSPMVALRDIYLNDEEATFFGRLAGSILHGRESSKERVEKARKVFSRLLFTGHSMGISDVNRDLIDEIQKTLLQVEDKAVVERLQAIGEIDDLCEKSTITDAPTLILWAEEEQHVLRIQSHNFRLLSNQPGRTFPAAQSIVLTSNQPDKRLKHASLLAHSTAYNKCLKEFYLKYFSETAQ